MLYVIFGCILVLIFLLYCDVLKHKKKKAYYNKYKYCTPSEIRLIEMLKEIGFEERQIFYNLYVPNSENYQQIDVLVVCKIGIIVFEVKDYQGLISGGIDDKYWRAIYSWHNFYEMYNPITQNSNHIECLRKYLKELNFINVVVFFGSCELKYTKFLSKTCCVIYGNYLQDCIKYLYFHNKKNNSTIKKEYSDFLNKFMENGNNEDIRKQHNDNVLKIKIRNNEW